MCVFYFYNYEQNALFWIISFISYFCYACIGNVITYHKYLAHSSFKLKKIYEKLFTFIGTLSGTGSSITWVTTHFQHHKYSDTEKDPHSPHNGLIKILTLDFSNTEANFSAKRLIIDKYHIFLDKYYYYIHLFFSFIIYSIFGIHLLFSIYIFPVLLTILISTYVINTLNHTVGYRNYDTKDKSTNNFFSAIIGFGEGWHNNHHHFPKDSNFGKKWWELDISYVIIKLIQSKS